MKKVLLVLAIAGMFVTPMMPATKAYEKPKHNGDIIFTELKGLWDYPLGPDHAAIWDQKKDKIIEADPYFDNWHNKRAWWRPDHPKLGNLYPNGDSNYQVLLKYLTYQSYHDRSWGKVEYDSIQHGIWNVKNYTWCWYGRVWGRGIRPDQAVEFAENKIGHPFDYVSPWYVSWGGHNSKQVDEKTSNEKIYFNESWLKLGKGYYCSELVWAAWKKGGKIDLIGTEMLFGRENLKEMHMS